MTTDADAFLNAIAETPDEDAPRLVYADWLDEQGDHARAEFIRVQCAAEALPEGHPQRKRLERRDSELLDEHRSSWDVGLCEDPSDTLYRRGFIDKIKVDDADWVRRLPTLAAVRPHVLIKVWCTILEPTVTLANMPELADVRRLELESFTESFEDHLNALLRSPYLQRLTELNILECRYSPTVLAAWPGLADIRKLTIFSNSLRVMLESSGLPRLRSLELYDGGDECGDAIRALVDWPGLENLEELELNDVSDDTLQPLAESGRAVRLRRLCVNSNDVSSAACLRLLSAGLPGLRDLEFETFAEDTDAVVGSVPSASEAGEPLDRLWIAGLLLGDTGATWLAACPRLAGASVLSFQECGIGSNGARALAASPNLAGLQFLVLRSNPLGPKGVRALARSPHLVGLKSLDLSETRPGKAGLEALSRSPWVRSLTSLDLSGNSFSSAARRFLAERPFDSIQSLRID